MSTRAQVIVSAAIAATVLSFMAWRDYPTLQKFYEQKVTKSSMTQREQPRKLPRKLPRKSARMPLYTYNGKLLTADGKLAANEACCCGGGCVGEDCTYCNTGTTPCVITVTISGCTTYTMFNGTFRLVQLSSCVWIYYIDGVYSIGLELNGDTVHVYLAENGAYTGIAHWVDEWIIGDCASGLPDAVLELDTMSLYEPNAVASIDSCEISAEECCETCYCTRCNIGSTPNFVVVQITGSPGYDGTYILETRPTTNCCGWWYLIDTIDSVAIYVNAAPAGFNAILSKGGGTYYVIKRNDMSMPADCMIDILGEYTTCTAAFGPGFTCDIVLEVLDAYF